MRLSGTGGDETARKLGRTSAAGRRDGGFLRYGARGFGVGVPAEPDVPGPDSDVYAIEGEGLEEGCHFDVDGYYGAALRLVGLH